MKTQITNEEKNWRFALGLFKSYYRRFFDEKGRWPDISAEPKTAPFYVKDEIENFMREKLGVKEWWNYDLIYFKMGILSQRNKLELEKDLKDKIKLCEDKLYETTK